MQIIFKRIIQQLNDEFEEIPHATSNRLFYKLNPSFNIKLLSEAISNC